MDTNLTKNRMTESFKKLMEKKMFSAISISDICDECGMHRKSFYYHFKDKYDLVTWIYDIELGAYMECHRSELEITGGLELVREYLYDNREYYSKLLHIEGQNSFREHLRERILLSAKRITEEFFRDEQPADYRIAFVADGISELMIKWIKEKQDITPRQMMEKITECCSFVHKIYDRKIFG